MKLTSLQQKKIKGYGIITKKDGELVMNILNKKYPVPKGENLLISFLITAFENEATELLKKAEKIRGKKLWKIVPVTITLTSKKK